MNLYDFVVKDAQGLNVKMRDYKDRVLLIVNTASACGFTPQYNGLEQLYSEFKDRNFTVLAFPCNQFGGQELASDFEIQEFCKSNYNISFPVLAKIKVNGKEEAPLFTYLKMQHGGLFGSTIKWNFTKFLIDSRGRVVKRYAPQIRPELIREDILRLLP